MLRRRGARSSTAAGLPISSPSNLRLISSRVPENANRESDARLSLHNLEVPESLDGRHVNPGTEHVAIDSAEDQPAVSIAAPAVATTTLNRKIKFPDDKEL